MNTLSRRRFVQAAGIGFMAYAYEDKGFGQSGALDRSFEHGRPLKQFQYNQIQFQAGLHQAQLDQTHTILMGLNDDSLLKPYRLRAGLPAPGCDLGGWYSQNDFVPGATFGQWISALSRYYAITGDEQTRQKIDRLVRAFGATIESTGRFYAGYTQPAYAYDKLACGLIDAHRFARQPAALDVLYRATDAALPHLPGKAIEQDSTQADESYTLPENQLIAWQCGGSPNHLAIAKQYLYHEFFDSLARGENVLPGRHAYSHVNALSSATKAFLVLGDERYLQAAKNGFAFVEAQSYATGGWGPNETFLPTVENLTGDLPLPAVQTLADSLRVWHTHFETPCGAYAHFKLTRYLLRITKDSTYGDSMERVMFNTVLGAKALSEDGRAFYYSDYNGEARKGYFDGFLGLATSEWPCCSGTLPQIAADYRISTYFEDADGVYVNLFIPSTLQWQRNGTRIFITQSGVYPLCDTVSFSLNTSSPLRFAIRLRIPAWAHRATVRINGEPLRVSIQPGRFVALNREWHSGDNIVLELPRRLELKAVDEQHRDIVALVCGPLVLFPVLDRLAPPPVTRSQLLSAKQQSHGSTGWLVDTNDGPLRLAPFWALKNERYSTYMSVA
jgi:DUF1680 family protein